MTAATTSSCYCCFFFLPHSGALKSYSSFSNWSKISEVGGGLIDDRTRVANSNCLGLRNARCESTRDCQRNGCDQYRCSTVSGGYCIMAVRHSGLNIKKRLVSISRTSCQQGGFCEVGNDFEFYMLQTLTDETCDSNGMFSF